VVELMPTPITPVALTVGSLETWVTVDVSAHVPSGTTGVMIRVRNDTGNGAIGYRKTGSTDTFTTNSLAGRTGFICVGVDGSRRVDLYKQYTNFSFDLIGHFGAEAVFFTNAVSKGPYNSSSTWTDVDISGDTGGDTAVAAIVAIDYGQTRGARKNGSTDPPRLTDESAGTLIVGCDGSEVFEIQTEGNGVNQRVLGYLKSAVTMHTDAIDRSLGSTGVFTDLAALPAGAVMGIYSVFGAGNAALRKNGASEDYSGNGLGDCHAIVECDGSRLVEGRIASTGTDFYELGYFTTAAALPSLTDVDSDEILTSAQSGATFTGSNLGATTGDRTVALVQGSTVVTQTQTGGNSTSGTFNVTGFGAGGLLRYGTATTLRVTVGSDVANFSLASVSGQTAPITPPAGRAWVTFGSLETTAAYRLEGDPGDIAPGHQLEYDTAGGTLTVNSNGTVSGTSGSTTSIVGRIQDGSGWSADVTVPITGGDVPVIGTQPSAQTVLRGATATFSVSASGSAPLSYQWRKNGAAIGGATAATYTTPATTDFDNGALYSVVVTNSLGVVTSSAALLTVNVAPAITTQPANVSVASGQAATFSVVATGRPSPAFQWRRDGVDIAGATNATYTTPLLSLSDSGAQFTVVLSSSVGNVTSSAAVLTVTAVTAPVQPPVPGAILPLERVSKVAIANQALTKLGVSLIESFTEDSKAARTMAAIYDRIRDAELSRRWWNFAKARKRMPEAINDEPTGPFRYSYALPADWLTTIYVGNLPLSMTLTDLQTYDPGDWSHEGAYILTNTAPPADLFYVRRITDPTRYHALFVEALACRLAMEAADALTNSLTRWEKCAAEYKDAIKEARRANAIQNPPQSLQDGSWLGSRH
jgi:hypothetical protein